MTHTELVEIGYKWVLNKCAFAIKELVTHTNEQPDVIGFNANGSFLLEAKTSRSDFLSDKKKPFRIVPSEGMGDWRFYIAPKGMIKIEELPTMWGLIEVNEKGKATCSYNPFGKGNIYSNWLRNDKCEGSERIIMFSALRRLQKNKMINTIYKDK
ncbi:hypothetical protein HX063_06060 [Myroides odoratimimus]|uniref:hypothetical protein n=1 Tax=Myroides odoratimimus TaxID=76832 RepID=UPI0025750AB9|nr:hypothetical protein [Myroides odoratimimus]MDM1494977.1 hypothetical protein [Myroides odoratimimus]